MNKFTNFNIYAFLNDSPSPVCRSLVIFAVCLEGLIFYSSESSFFTYSCIRRSCHFNGDTGVQNWKKTVTAQHCTYSTSELPIHLWIFTPILDGCLLPRCMAASAPQVSYTIYGAVLPRRDYASQQRQRLPVVKQVIILLSRSDYV